MSKNTLVRIYKNNFGFPTTINLGHSLFMCSIGTLIVYLIQKIVVRFGVLFTTTSLVGYFILISLLTVFALLIPFATLFFEKQTNPRNNIVDSVGSYSGLGILLLSLLSGVALPFIKIPLHNLCSWIWLRGGNTIVLPAFLNINDGTSTIEQVLSYFANTAIPAFGIAFFFTGLLWECLPKSKKAISYAIVALSFAVFSLNPTDFIGLLFVGLWIVFLRDKAGNAIAPLFALLGSGVSEIFLPKLVESVDITMVQVYSDISPTILYSSAPSFIAGLILLGVFIKPINTFNLAYNSEYGFENDSKERSSQGLTLNLALIVAVIIFIILWVMVFKGESL